MRDTWHVGRRFMWWAPWGVTRPWLPRVFPGGDECGNPSVAVVLPFLGCVTVFYGRRLSALPLECDE